MQKQLERIRRLNALLSETNGVYHSLAQHLGLSDSTMQVLYTALAEGGSCTVRQVCLLTGTSRQTISSALRKMEQAKLISLQAVDGKQKRILLTEEGRALAERTAGVELKLEAAIFESWADADAEAYLHLSERYLKDLRSGMESMKRNDQK